MINQFEDGKIYIFDMATYLVYNDENVDIIENCWIQECNQRTVNVIDKKQGCIVVDGTLFHIVPKWCKEKEFTIRKLNLDM